VKAPPDRGPRHTRQVPNNKDGRRLRVQSIGEVERSVVAANVAAAYNHVEEAVIAVRSRRAFLNIQGATTGREIRVRGKPIAGIGIDGAVAAIAAKDVSPARIRCGRRGCGRTVILRASEDRVGIR